MTPTELAKYKLACDERDATDGVRYAFVPDLSVQLHDRGYLVSITVQHDTGGAWDEDVAPRAPPSGGLMFQFWWRLLSVATCGGGRWVGKVASAAACDGGSRQRLATGAACNGILRWRFAVTVYGTDDSSRGIFAVAACDGSLWR